MTASEAREAAAWHRDEGCRNRNDGFGGRMRMHDRAALALDAYADGFDAAAVEREACAALCEAGAACSSDARAANTANALAWAIRARGAK